MHICDGVLSTSLAGNGALVAASVASAAGISYGLRRMKDEDTPKVALLSAAFFVISLPAIPVGVSTTHLMATGLMGLILGWATFPAVFVALLIQFFAFGEGGLTTLGVNTLVMASPGVLCHYVLGRMAASRRMPVVQGAGALAGVLGVLGSLALLTMFLAIAGRGFLLTESVHAVSYFALIPIEAFMTAVVVGFLLRVRPELLAIETEPSREPAPVEPSVAAATVDEEATEPVA